MSILDGLSVSFFGATYAIFLQSKGLNLYEINLVNCAFFLTLTLAEIPTGAFADVFGRKASYIMSCAITAVGLIIYSMSESFWWFILAEVIIAIGGTFCSGAFNAWFVDKIKHHGHTDSMTSIMARNALLRQGGVIFGSIIGSLAYHISPIMPWILSTVFCVVCGLCALLIKEEYFQRQKFSFKDGFVNMTESTIESLKYGYANANVRFLLVTAVVLVFCMQALNMQWQPRFNASLGDERYLGLIHGVTMACIMFGARLVEYLKKQFSSERKIIVYAQLLIGVFVIGAGSISWLPGTIIFFWLHEVGRGVAGPIRIAYLQDNIPSKQRATIDSCMSLFRHFGAMLGLFISGVLAHNYGISFTWLFMGVLLSAVMIIFVRSGSCGR